jgi:hypothetical protein
MSQVEAIFVSQAVAITVNGLLHILHARWTARKDRKRGIPLEKPL